MIYVLKTENGFELSDSKNLNAQSRWDWDSFEEVTAIAESLTEKYGKKFLPTESSSCFPKFDVIEAPEVGDFVSRSFNGDSYPVGKIVKISSSYRRIQTEDGTIFYRRQHTGSWVNNSFFLVKGNHSELNPHF